jgi:hypothetical protein
VIIVDGLIGINLLNDGWNFWIRLGDQI